MESLRDQILFLQQHAAVLEPDAAVRSDWNEKVLAYADQFIGDMDNEPAFRNTHGYESGLLNTPIEEHGRPLEELLQVLEEYVDRPGLNPASGGHLGYIPGGGIYPSALGDFLAAVTNRYAGIYFGGPGAVLLENMLIRWMCKLIGFPENALGNLASGGSIANLIAICTARDLLGIKSRMIDQCTIYLTEQVHHCVQKAIRIAGMGEAHIRYVPVDAHFRMDISALRAQIAADKAEGLRPFLMVGSAGTTDTGAIDPLNSMADIAAEHRIWFHIDAAYGGFFTLVDELRPAFKGIERADSVAIDPHKGLFLSYGLGAVLMRDVEAQYKSHYYRAAYMQDSLRDTDELSPADLSPELTKHFRGLRMWLALQLFGIAPFRKALEEKHLLARYFHQEVQKLGFEVGPQPELSVVVYRYQPPAGTDINAFNRSLVDYLHNDGRIFVSSTTIKGEFWIRLAVLSFRTHLSHIDLFLQMLAEGLSFSTNTVRG